MRVGPTEQDAIDGRWSLPAVRELFLTPLLDLVYRAASVHRAEHDPRVISRSALLSIKTGGCPEDCGYCPQSVHNSTGVVAENLLSLEAVVEAAHQAKKDGCTRFCMGAAWRGVEDGEDFDQVLAMVRAVADMEMEVCVTLGMLKAHQAKALRETGLNIYNHNIDTSPRVYETLIQTREFDDRIATLEVVAAAGLKICCGGIVGLGENDTDRIVFLHTLANIRPALASVPINVLVPVPGTPLENQGPLDPLVVVRVVAAARVLMPKSEIKLAAGRDRLDESVLALCFLAGANALFYGEELLTAPNQVRNVDDVMMDRLGLRFEIPTASRAEEPA